MHGYGYIHLTYHNVARDLRKGIEDERKFSYLNVFGDYEYNYNRVLSFLTKKMKLMKDYNVSRDAIVYNQLMGLDKEMQRLNITTLRY